VQAGLLEDGMGIELYEEMLPGGIRKLTITGTLDAPGAMSIEDNFQAHMSHSSDHIIVDLSQVEYMSSYGLRMLLTAAKALYTGGGGLHLAGPNEHVMKVISVAGYDTMFPVYESVEEALTLLGK
jgi:anti-anti-sigma factor